eukprot:g2671.t1
MNKNQNGVRPILGTMTFAGQSDKAVALEQLQDFARCSSSSGFKCELDTARMYEHGETEKLLGELLNSNEELKSFIVATKMNPFGGYDNRLSHSDCMRQCAASLTALRSEKVKILYLHAPCVKTKIEETLNAVKELHEAGFFEELGLSNHSASEVMHIWHLCKEMNMVLPTVYQGMYNAITRAIEAELLPVCRQLKMRFYAYNPLAGGMLTGKHVKTEAKLMKGKTPTTGRFKNQRYRDRFFRPSYFRAVEMVGVCTKAAGIPPAEAALRWLAHHSKLSNSRNDAIIIGASSVEHYQQNMNALKKGPLPEAVVAVYDMAWKLCKGDCPCYFRGFSGSKVIDK